MNPKIGIATSADDSGTDCELCHKTFHGKWKQRTLETHLQRRHLREKPVKCTICNEAFFNTTDRKRHHKIFHQNSEKPESSACQRKRCFFGRKSAVKNPCDFCLIKFDNRHMVRHLNGIHNKSERYWCKFCGIKLNTKKDLLAHLNHHHTENTTGGSALHCCHVCNKQFQNEYIFLKHFLDNHEREKIYKKCTKYLTCNCEICGVVFKSSKSKKKHIRFVHNNEINFKCDLCDKQFGRRGDFNRHQNIHSGIKKFPCQYCDKRLSTKGSMSRHERMHTGERPFSCFICGDSFFAGGDLQIHMRIHTGERPYKCIECGESFIAGNRLKSHVLLKHTNKKEWQCDRCGKCFLSKCILGAHMKRCN